MSDTNPIEPAYAKLNLCLHVVGRRPDGYHLLESLVVFPRIGDRIEAEPAKTLSLSLAGPFGRDLGGGDDNLVLRAALALRDWVERTGRRPEGAALRLTKNLPVASGIGGGSSDAAAALRALSRLWRLDPPEPELRDLALRLGADVPVCLAQAPAIMRGVGEDLRPAPALPPCAVVLANPGVAVSTPEAFAALERKDNPPPPPPPESFQDVPALIAWLERTANHLQPPVERLRPVVAETCAALAAQPACRLARMSGSGATCFGLFDDAPAAEAAADALRAAEPRWWVAAAPL